MYRVTIYEGDHDKKGTVIHSPYVDTLKLMTGNVKLGLSLIDTFSFTIHPNHPSFYHITPLLTLITVEDSLTDVLLFDGRVLAPVDEMDSSGAISRHYLCESTLGYLHDSVQSWKKLSGKATAVQLFKEVLRVHNQQVEPYKQFQVGRITVTDKSDYARFIDDTIDSYDTLTEKLLKNELLGGELQVRLANGVRYLDWLTKIGETSLTDIKLAKNLISLSKEIDPTEVITRLFPRGATLEANDEHKDNSQPRVTIASVNGGKEYLDASKELIKKFGIQGGYVTFDDVTKETILLTKGKKWLVDQFVATGNCTVEAADLSLIKLDPDRFKVGNSYRVSHSLIGVDTFYRIIDMTLDINNPASSSLTLGQNKLTLSQYQVQTNKIGQSMTDLRDNAKAQQASLNHLNETVTTAKQVITDLENDSSDIQRQLTVIFANLQEMAETLPNEEVVTELAQQVASVTLLVEEWDNKMIGVRQDLINQQKFKQRQQLVNYKQWLLTNSLVGRLEKLEGKEE